MVLREQNYPIWCTVMVWKIFLIIEKRKQFFSSHSSFLSILTVCCNKLFKDSMPLYRIGGLCWPDNFIGSNKLFDVKMKSLSNKIYFFFNLGRGPTQIEIGNASPLYTRDKQIMPHGITKTYLHIFSIPQLMYFGTLII